MHFVIHKDLRTNPVIRWTLAFYSLALAIYLAFRPWIEAERTGLSADRYWRTVHGDPAKFIQPVNKLDFATVIHTDLFFDSLMAVILSAILIRVPAHRRIKHAHIAILLGFPVAVAAFGALTHFGFEFAAALRVSSFWCLWFAQMFAVAKNGVYLLRPAR